MEKRVFETAFGRLWLWGEARAFEGSRPLVLVIRGALAAPTDFEWLAAPAGHDIVFLHLPGFNCPFLVDSSIGLFIAAFDILIREAFVRRQVTVVGVSAGALVAAGLRCPQLVARVFVEPFFSTAKLEPLAAMVREHRSEISEPFWPWLWTVLGISAEAVEDRRYEHLLVGDLPIHAVVGDVPLSRPEAGQLPSLTDEADRARLVAAGARLRIARGGHDLPSSDRDAVTETVLAATVGRA